MCRLAHSSSAFIWFLTHTKLPPILRYAQFRIRSMEVFASRLNDRHGTLTP